MLVLALSLLACDGERLPPLQSHAWVRLHGVSDGASFTAHRFVATSMVGFCAELRAASEAAQPLFADFATVRDTGASLDERGVCLALRTLTEAMADVTADLLQPGAVLLSFELGLDAADSAGAPEDGLYGIAEPGVESGRFFRARARFIDENPFAATTGSLACDGDPSVPIEAVRDFAGERDGEAGTLELAGRGDRWEADVRNVTVVDSERREALSASWSGTYAPCDLALGDYFVPVWDR
jgi:hypothetical protein